MNYMSNNNDNLDRLYACQYMLHLDSQFGKILGALKDVYSNTLIIVVSDNGGSLTSGSCNCMYN